jgi:hypothetical protein
LIMIIIILRLIMIIIILRLIMIMIITLLGTRMSKMNSVNHPSSLSLHIYINI